MKAIRTQPGQNLTVGMIGLGVGTLALYCEPGDTFVFYEINPQVVTVAETYFSYLKNCANISTKVGDARTVLTSELAEGLMHRFDLLVVDAFTDDAIPSHLLTREALDLYMSQLKPTGIVAFHTSNAFLRFDGVLQAHAKERSLQITKVFHKPATEGEQVNIWILLGAESSPISTITHDVVPLDDTFVLWTDDLSSLLPILRLSP